MARETTEVIWVGTLGVIMASTGITCTVAPPGAVLEVVLAMVTLAEQDGRMEITA